MNTDAIITILEYIGVISFAVSGASKAVAKENDILGVIVIAAVTAAGGGFVRDTVIGVFPQTLFEEPSGALTAAAAGAAVFAVRYAAARYGARLVHSGNAVMYIADTAGLAAFTVIGVGTGISAGYGQNTFLLVFLGTITGVGGGILRDLFLKEIPEVFMKHIYGCASIAGAAVCVFLSRRFGMTAPVMLVSAAVTAAARAAAIIFRLDLPSVHTKNGAGDDSRII